MRILFLTDNFPPEVNAPASRTYEHCKEWVKAGADVTVITCAPNFPQGKVYEGYKNKLYQKEIIDVINCTLQESLVRHNIRPDTYYLNTINYLLLIEFILIAFVHLTLWKVRRTRYDCDIRPSFHPLLTMLISS